jgi:hypothetical protein
MSTHPEQALAAGPAVRTETPEARRETVRSVRWALIIACAYLVLFSEQPSQSLGLGGIVIALFLASNLILGRIPAATVGAPEFNVGLALVDTIFIGASLYFAGQLSVELVFLCLGVLVLAIAGLGTGAIAIGTIGLALCYLLIVAVWGAEPLLRSGILLRAPFLLSAAIVYAWLVEHGRKAVSVSAESPAPAPVRDLAHSLEAQREAIERCRAAFAEGLPSAAESALAAIATENRDMSDRLERLAPASAPKDQGHGTPAVAHGAA